MESSAALKLQITDIEIQQIKAKKDARLKLKRRLAEVEQDLKGQEQYLIELLDNGAEVISEREIKIKNTERRYPSWKEHFISLCGKDLADEVLESTEPKIHRELIIK
jgi:hypothetical protein